MSLANAELKSEVVRCVNGDCNWLYVTHNNQHYFDIFCLNGSVFQRLCVRRTSFKNSTHTDDEFMSNPRGRVEGTQYIKMTNLYTLCLKGIEKNITSQKIFWKNFDDLKLGI